MDRLWAPWRIGYITKKNKEKKCTFCRIYKEKKDNKNLVIYRSKYCFSLLNLYPYNNGHAMVVTNRHIKTLDKLSKDEMLDLMCVTIKTQNIIKKVLRPEGFNLGMNIEKVAGAGIASHLHLHIVPRWQGDTNFMPTIGNTKVISQDLKELYKSIKRCLQEKK